MPHSTSFSTNYASPWVLIERNSGHQLAYITLAKIGDDGRMIYKGYIWSEASQSYSKTQRPISTDRIRKFWRNPPSLNAINRAKRGANKRLRKLEREHHFGRALRGMA